jgi:hypothetical protein
MAKMNDIKHTLGEAVDRVVKYTDNVSSTKLKKLVADTGHDRFVKEKPETFVFDLSLGEIPPPADHLKSSIGQTVMKMCSDSEWHPRVLIATAEKLIVSHPGSTEISDQIFLVSHRHRTSLHQHVSPRDAATI